MFKKREYKYLGYLRVETEDDYKRVISSNKMLGTKTCPHCYISYSPKSRNRNCYSCSNPYQDETRLDLVQPIIIGIFIFALAIVLLRAVPKLNEYVKYRHVDLDWTLNIAVSMYSIRMKSLSVVLASELESEAFWVTDLETLTTFTRMKLSKFRALYQECEEELRTIYIKNSRQNSTDERLFNIYHIKFTHVAEELHEVIVDVYRIRQSAISR